MNPEILFFFFFFFFFENFTKNFIRFPFSGWSQENGSQRIKFHYLKENIARNIARESKFKRIYFIVNDSESKSFHFNISD